MELSKMTIVCYRFLLICAEGNILTAEEEYAAFEQNSKLPPSEQSFDAMMERVYNAHQHVVKYR